MFQSARPAVTTSTVRSAGENPSLATDDASSRPPKKGSRRVRASEQAQKRADRVGQKERGDEQKGAEDDEGAPVRAPTAMAGIPRPTAHRHPARERRRRG